MKKYKVLNKEFYSYNDYSLVSIREEDIYLIKIWRNSQMDVLRQKKILTDQDQQQYYLNIIAPAYNELHPEQILFSYLFDNKCIGYGGLTNIDWESRRAEMSFLDATERTKDKNLYKIDFKTFITIIKTIIFDELDFNRLFTETYDIRQLHIEVLENNGFQFEGRMKHHVLINGEFKDSLIHGLLKYS